MAPLRSCIMGLGRGRTLLHGSGHNCRRPRQFSTSFLPHLTFQEIITAKPIIHPKGKAALIVNTASLCGLTPQLKELEMVHRRFQGKLIVYGLPCNDFGGQEPWEEEKIAKFYKKEFGVTFKLTSKIHVMGPECHSLYSAVHKEYGADACPSWNFHKLLIDQSGDLTGVFGHALSPCEPEVTEAIEDAIKD